MTISRRRTARDLDGGSADHPPAPLAILAASIILYLLAALALLGGMASTYFAIAGTDEADQLSEQQTYGSADMATQAVVFFVLAGLYGLFGYHVRRGRRWAAITAIGVLTLVGIAALGTVAMDPRGLIAAGIALAVILLLTTRRSRAYLSHKHRGSSS